MLDVMYEVPSAKKDKFVLTKDFAEKQMAKAKSLKA
jgi:ATP-dependent Clp protease ATP-binding subunit ClpX